MKTKEFIEKTKSIGFNINIRCEDIQVHHHRYGLIATVQINKRFVFDIKKYFDLTSLKEQEKLFSCLVEYASTPLEEREEEKKYRYKIKFDLYPGRNIETLHIFKYSDGTVALDGSSDGYVNKAENFHFTDKEVEQYTGKDRALFNACEKIEVTP